MNAAFIRELREAEDVRYVELSGKEPMFASRDGHITIMVDCPFHVGDGKSCRVHFGLDGNGRWYCKPCQSLGSAEHDVDERGRRSLALTLEGSSEGLGSDWKH